MAIENVEVNITDTTLLTVPSGKRYAITTLMVCNTASFDSGGANDSQFDLHFIKNGQAKSDRNKIVNLLNVAGADTFTFDTEKIVLEEGDTIVLMGQGPANLSATVSYLEV